MAMTAEERSMRRPTTDDTGSGSGALITVWLLLLGLYAGVFAWLLVNADDTISRRTIELSRIEMPLPESGETMSVSSEPTAPPKARQPALFGLTDMLTPGKETGQSGPMVAAEAPAKSTPIDPMLLESSRSGPLPTIAPDGRQPWRYYSRPFNDPLNRPRIAVVITGLGLNAIASESAIDRMPGDITFAFSPYADVARLTEMARKNGHEILMSLPLEPMDYPQHDPGPFTLMTGLSEVENLARLETVMGRASGYVGLVGEFGSRFTTRATNMLPVLEQMRKRGLMFVDAAASPETVSMRVGRDLSIPRAINNRTIDVNANRAAIDANLVQAERTAKATGQVVIFASPHLVTIDRLAEWFPTLAKKGLVLAPITAIVGRQPDL